MTSVAREAQRESVDMETVAREVARSFGHVFGLTCTPRSRVPAKQPGRVLDPSHFPLQLP